MKQTAQELIDYLDKSNRWKHDAADNAEAIDQAVDLLKTKTWQPMETAPKDREFLGVWGPKDPPPGEAFDVFIYDEDRKRFMFSSHGAHIYLPIETYGPWAWMEIPKYEP